MKKIGFLINPVAGMGGSVGLKGTDGLAEKAMELGAVPLSGKKALEALKSLEESDLEFEFITCPGNMGASVLEGTPFRYEVIGGRTGKTTAEDTKNACRTFLEKKADLIVFAGGDGTARDIFSVTGSTVPVLGIPSGVKMHSAVFALSPGLAGRVIEGFLEGRLELKDAEIMDIDEEAYRGDRLEAMLYGYVKTPYEKTLVQGGKQTFHEESDEDSKEKIALFAREFMRDGSCYIIGAGSTTSRILEGMGLEGTLLGVDVVRDGKLMARDVNEKKILEILEKEGKAKIIVGVIGAQGFVFGRGNQQLSARVIKKAGPENVIIVATPHKLKETPQLIVDTGDPELDRALSGRRQIVCGYRMAQRRDVIAV